MFVLYHVATLFLSVVRLPVILAIITSIVLVSMCHVLAEHLASLNRAV